MTPNLSVTMPKAPAKKVEKKPAKKASVVETENLTADAPETPVVETVVTETSAAENVEAAVTEANAEVADAKNASTHAEAESQPTKPADAKQQDINEELERQ